MKRFLVASSVVGAVLTFGMSTVFALPANVVGFGQKMKAQKTQSDLVPAFACGEGDTAPDCAGSLLVGAGGDGNQSKSAKSGKNCTFLTGTVKMQVGKDTQVQLKGVTCGGSPGTPASGFNLCGQTIGYSTISNVTIDKKGVVTEIAACGPIPGGIQGSSNYTTAIVANTISCNKGTCKGALSSGAASALNPCPHSDTISEVRRIEIFDGPDIAKINVLGTDLSVCCGLNQQVVPGSAVDSTLCPRAQDVLAVPGSLSRGTP